MLAGEIGLLRVSWLCVRYLMNLVKFDRFNDFSKLGT